MSLLQRPREGPPLPQVPADNAVPAPRVAAPLPAQEQQQPLPSHKPSFTAAAAVLSPNAFVQAPPQLQREREHPQHRSVPADGTSATATSRGGGGDIDDSSSAPSDASVPASWPCESSALPHHDEDSGRSSDGTYQFTTTSSTMTGRRPVSPEHTTSVRSSDDTTCLVDLRRRDAAQVEKCDRRRPTAPGAVGASAAVVSPSFSTSSCGCPSNCACRSDASDDDVFGRLDACTDCRERAAQDMTRCSDASSETGTTPLQRSSEEDGDDLCSSCRQHRCDCGHPSFEWRRAQRGDGEFSLKLSSQGSSEGDSGSGEDASLCSLCKDAARTRAVHQAGAAAFFAHQEDPFSEAVREDRRCAGVPPLLRLSTPSSSASTKRGSASDAVTMAQRERADRRMVYMQSAAALASDAGGERRGAHDAAVAAVRGLDRCTGSTQTDTVAAAAATATLSEEQRRLHAEQEAAALKSIAAAHVAEVTRPLLQGELASFEARAAVQQQARFDVVESQLRVYLDEFRQRMQELSDLQMQQHATRQEEAEAVRRAAARVDRATSPMDSALIAEAAASTPQAAPSPVPPQRTVGTQHSDGTLELLTIVRTEAASWMAQLLFSIEAERRDAVMQDEAESRDRLLHVMEEPRRRQLLRYQAELLHWQQECAAVRHRASFASDLLALELRERLVRQELNEEASVARRELGEAFERQRCQAAEAAAHSQVKALEDELVKVRSKLSIVEAEHADTLEHAKQLRLQLIHALRMPTVTLVDRSGVPAAARGAAGQAHRVAAMTVLLLRQPWRCSEAVTSWRRGTVSIHEVDAWLRFNPYIRRGFRHRFLRKREALGSIVLYFHNETFNIVSHLAMAVLMALLLLWPPRVTAMSSGGGASDIYDGVGGGYGLEAAEVPSWLRGLHGLAAASGATAAGTDNDGTQGCAPSGDETAFPRHVLSDAAAGAATSSPSFRFFASLSGDSAAPSSPAWIVSGIDSALPPPPMSVAARLSLSLTPLVLGFLLTFVMSVLYHAFMPCCRSRRGYQQLLQCDVMGVVCAISGSAYAYFTCGMPCAGEYVQAWTAALMVAATLLCIYVVVLVPMWGVVADVCALALHLVQWVAAAVIAAVLEFLMGRPLPSAPPCPLPVQRGGRDRDSQSRPLPPPEHHSRQHLLLAWVQQHRHLYSVQLGDAPTAAAPAVAANTSIDLVPLSALQRSTVVGAYCLLHLYVYLALVYPKSRAAMGGFTQATHYHNASYVWLCLGGLINAARFPEVVVFHWTRRAAQMDARGAPMASSSSRGSARPLRASPGGVATELAAQATSVLSTSSPPATTPTLWDRLCIPKLMVTYVVSASTLDYIGNSHNIWHVCTALSALSAILGVYYDCMEYDLRADGGHGARAVHRFSRAPNSELQHTEGNVWKLIDVSSAAYRKLASGGFAGSRRPHRLGSGAN
ncbi:hemolysin-III related protein family protein [Leishmania donovani]|uniref:Hemolysin-III related protein family protein n=1 Tax=Leishmania donovani TaxID=5661 RepID=A0A504Y1U3_LEIDO|nr:hemolysin-III related protein family protein [Leishmania donovani]